MKEKNQGKFSGSSLRTALLFSVLLCFFRGNLVDHPLGPDSGCREILTMLKLIIGICFFGWFHSLSFACELNPVFATHRILLSRELGGEQASLMMRSPGKGLEASHWPRPQESQGTLSSQEQRADP